MKKKIMKAALLTGAALVLVVATVLGTIAYMTATSFVTNTFTVGNVGIEMYETKVGDDGKKLSSGEKVNGNQYHLMPGGEYDKDPTIHILETASNDEMYLFVKSYNQLREHEAVSKPMRKQMEANGWVQLVKSGSGYEIVWVYGTRDDAGNIIPTKVKSDSVQYGSDGNPVANVEEGCFRLCETLTINPSVSDISALASSTVQFTGFAIQAVDIDNAVEGWTAIEHAYPALCEVANPVNPYDASLNIYAPVPKS